MLEVCTSFSSRIFYRKMGTGPVAVLLHGFPESGTLWRNIWDHLATSYTLLIPDFAGAGDSALEGPVSMVQMAETVKAMLDAEQVGKAVLIGHSMGGYATFTFADLYPQYVQGISLVHSSPYADDEEKKKTRQKVIDLVGRGNSAKDIFLKQMVPGLFAQQFAAEHASLVEEQVVNSLIMSKEAVASFYTAMMEREDRSHVPAAATYPIHWVIGAQDSLIPVKKILGLNHMSAVNFTSYYKHVGHMSMVEAPEQLQNDLKEFLDYCYGE